MTGSTANSSRRMGFSVVLAGSVKVAYHCRTADGSIATREARWYSSRSEGTWPPVAAK